MEKTKENLINKDNVKLRVSSILDNNGKEFGSNKMLDGNEETCWSSGQGKVQSIIIEFKNGLKPNFSNFEFISQGGFCPKDIIFHVYFEDISINKNATSYLLKSVEDIKDISERQIVSFTSDDFHVLRQNTNNLLQKEIELPDIKALKLSFTKFYDFFGRITFYDIKLC